MDEPQSTRGFTIYLDGHEGHKGNVLASAFLAKASKVIVVLNSLERAYIESRARQTEFEIVGADKRNPTTISLVPTPTAKSYDPNPALNWGIRQLDIIGRGEDPDERVGGRLAYDIVDLSTKKQEYGYKAFWINGHAEAVRFDEDYRLNALRVARARTKRDAPQNWKVGAAQGSVVGELKAIDDLESGHEFVVVPPVGASQITCKFPEALRDKMGEFLFKTVRVSGSLNYGEKSPFPYLVDAKKIELMPKRRKTFAQMRGMFASRRPSKSEWNSLIDGQ